MEPIQELEDGKTRVEINLQKTEDRETGALTGNYALYLSVAERGLLGRIVPPAAARPTSRSGGRFPTRRPVPGRNCLAGRTWG
jgi:hypothetical protein